MDYKIKEKLSSCYFKVKRLRYTDLIFVILFSALFSSIMIANCTPRWMTDDDWGIANYFAGVLDADRATPYNMFINFILGWMMYGIYRLIPGINWFAVAQEFIVLFSFVLLHYFLIQKMKPVFSRRLSYLVSSVLIFLIEYSRPVKTSSFIFEPAYITRLQFTQTAAIGSIMGLVWMVYAHEKKNTKGFIMAVVFTVFASLFRFGSFEMCLPFFGLILIAFTFGKTGMKSFRKIPDFIGKNKKLYLSVALIVIGSFALSKVNAGIYNSDYYAEYNAFNSARASVLDYEKSDYSEISDELKKIGVSENDYILITSWAITDRSFITADLLRSIEKVEPKKSGNIDYKEDLNNYFIELGDFSNSMNLALFMALGLLLLSVAVDFRRMKFYAPVLAFAIMGLEVYFKIFVRRYLPYVRAGYIFAAIAACLVITNYDKLKFFNEKRKRASFAMVCVFAFLVCCVGNAGFKSGGRYKYEMDYLHMYEYLNSREDDVFMFDTNVHLSLIESYNIFEETKPGIMRHTVSLGGWSTNNPWINEIFSSWGIDYPLRQTADDNVYMLSLSGRIKKFKQYLSEHCSMDTTASMTNIQYGKTIFKITDRNMEVSPRKFAKISDAAVDYDEEYLTYDITVGFDLKEDFPGGNRVFLSLTDEDGVIGYYMVFDGHNMPLKAGENRVCARIPDTELKENAVYRVDLMIQTDDGNYLNTGSSKKILIEKTDVS